MLVPSISLAGTCRPMALRDGSRADAEVIGQERKREGLLEAVVMAAMRVVRSSVV